jgi:hypothetical protein
LRAENDSAQQYLAEDKKADMRSWHKKSKPISAAGYAANLDSSEASGLHVQWSAIL